MELKNKVVVITGGTKGLGKAMAHSFIKNEAKVVVCSRNESELEEISKEGIFGIKADVTKESDLTNLMEVAKEKFGQVDIWINNAGIWLPHAYAEDVDMDKVRKMFEVNVMGLMNGTRVALRSMKKKGTGVIVSIISDSALVGRPMSSAYSSSKWATNGFIKSVKEEDKNILFLSVYPGPIQTEIFGEKKPEGFENFMTPEYVAETIVENIKKETPEEELIIKRD